MTKEELIKFLKENLDLSVVMSKDYISGSDGYDDIIRVKVTLKLDGEEIAKDSDYVEVEGKE